MYGNRTGLTRSGTSYAMPIHIGTHIDAPQHFNPSGETIECFDADFWRFDSPYLIDCPKNQDELIGVEDISPKLGEMKSCDCLLLRTGFEKVRGEKLADDALLLS